MFPCLSCVCRRLLPGLLAALILMSHAVSRSWADISAIGAAEGSFETGLTGMVTAGDVRLVHGLGALRPPQGTQAVLLTTAPDGGELAVDVDVSLLRIPQVTVPAETPYLRLDYNVLTNEMASSLANDHFTVTLVLLSASGEETLLEVDTFTPLYPAPLTGYAVQTGFRTLVADLTAYAASGATVTLELRLADAGDGRLDSAVLLDHLHWASAEAPQAHANLEFIALDAGEVLYVYGGASTAGHAEPVEYRWDFGDGTVGIGRMREHTYTQDGLYQATLTVTDADGHTHTDTFLVAVGTVRHAPQIVSEPPVTVADHTPYHYTVEVIDPDLAFGDILTFALLQAPSGMQIDPVTGVITWTPTTPSSRLHPVTVQVTDREGLQDTQTFRIFVLLAGATVACDTLPVGSAPLLVTRTAHGIYVVDRPSQTPPTGTVWVVDPGTYSIVTKIPLGVGYPIGMASAPDGSLVYIVISKFAGSTSSSGGNHIAVLNTATSRLIATIPIAGSTATYIVVSPDGQRAYVTERLGSRIDVIATAQQTVSNSISVGGTPVGIAITPDGTRVYAVSRSPSRVTVIDTQTETVMTHLVTGLKNSNNTTAIAINPDGTRAYITSTSDGHVAVFDINPTSPTFHQRLGLLPTSSSALGGLAVRADGQRVFLASHNTDELLVLDTDTTSETYHTQVEAIPVGDLPVQVFYGNAPPVITSRPPVTARGGVPYQYPVVATAPASLLYVPNFNDGTLSVCTPGVFVSVVTFALLDAPTGMQIDPMTGVITWQPPVTALTQEAVTVQATDWLGGYARQTFIVTVEMANQPPIAVAGGPYTAMEGTPLMLDARASSDPDGDILTATWDLNGDGVFADATGLTPQVTFFTDGSYTVRVQVSDGVEVSTAAAIVTVINVPPTVEAGAAQSAEEGTAVAFAGSLSDPGSMDTHTIVWDFGDGSTHTGELQATHVYEQDGIYLVTLTVTDDAGGVGTDTLTVTVTNVAPAVQAGADQAVMVLDGVILVTATFVDSGVLDTHHATLDWGDGLQETAQLTQGAGIGRVEGTHGYAYPGTYTITVSVHDEAGGVGHDTLEVTVHGPRDLKTGIREGLLAHQNLSDRFAKAIREIEQSLEPSLWQDALHLEPQHGHRVFSEERHAVKELLDVLKHAKKTPADAQEWARQGIADLVTADRLLALTVIHELDGVQADTPHQQAKVAKERAHAQEALAHGDHARDAGEPDKAIEHYRQAWEHAQHAAHEIAKAPGKTDKRSHRSQKTKNEKWPSKPEDDMSAHKKTKNPQYPFGPFK